jgi:hypothetical protein
MFWTNLRDPEFADTFFGIFFPCTYRLVRRKAADSKHRPGSLVLTQSGKLHLVVTQLSGALYPISKLDLSTSSQSQDQAVFAS